MEWKFVLDDSTVVDERRFFGGIVCTKGFVFAINFDLCSKSVSSRRVHSSIPGGVC